MRSIICRYDKEFEHYSVPIDDDRIYWLKAKLPLSVHRFNKDDFVQNAIISILNNDNVFVVYDSKRNCNVEFKNDITNEIRDVLYFFADKVVIS